MTTEIKAEGDGDLREIKMDRLVKVAALWTAFAATANCFAQAQDGSRFEHVASYRSLGGLVARPMRRAPRPDRSAFTRAIFMTTSLSM